MEEVGVREMELRSRGLHLGLISKAYQGCPEWSRREVNSLSHKGQLCGETRAWEEGERPEVGAGGWTRETNCEFTKGVVGRGESSGLRAGQVDLDMQTLSRCLFGHIW